MKKCFSLLLAFALPAAAFAQAWPGQGITVRATNGLGVTTTLMDPIFAGAALRSTNITISSAIATNWYFTSATVYNNGLYVLVYSNMASSSYGSNPWMIWRKSVDPANTNFLSYNDPNNLDNFSVDGPPFWSLGPSNDVSSLLWAYSTQPIPSSAWRNSLNEDVYDMFGFFSGTNTALVSTVYFRSAPLVRSNLYTRYVTMEGDDLNDGLTVASAFRTGSRALQTTTNGMGVTNIVVGAGHFMDIWNFPTTNIIIRGAGRNLTIIENTEASGTPPFAPRAGCVLEDLSPIGQFTTVTSRTNETIVFRNMIAPYKQNIDAFVSGQYLGGSVVFDNVDFSRTTYDAEFGLSGYGNFYYHNCIKHIMNDGTTFPVHGIRITTSNSVYHLAGGSMILSNNVAPGAQLTNAAFYFDPSPAVVNNNTIFVGDMSIDVTSMSNSPVVSDYGTGNKVIWVGSGALLPRNYSTNHLPHILATSLYYGGHFDYNSNGTPYVILSGAASKTWSSTNPVIVALAPSPSITTNLYVFGTRYTNTAAGGFTGRRGSIGASVECVGALNSFAQATLQVESPNGITNIWIVGSGGLASQTNTLPLRDDIYPGDRWVFNTNLVGGTATMLRAVYKSD